MGKFDNLNDSQVPDLIRRIERLERASPVNNTAIGRGGIEVYDGGVIRITNGGLSVTGTATITGTLQADGTIAFTGTFTQSGPTTFTGTTNLNGPTNINGTTTIAGNVTSTGTFTNNGPTNLNGATKTTGTLSVEGVTTLKNDLNVTGGGKIVAGAVSVDPSYQSGSVRFSNGTYLAATPNGAQIASTGSSGVGVGVGAGQAFMNATSGYVVVDGGGATLASYGGGSFNAFSTGGVGIGGLPTKTGVAANLHADPTTGRIYRVV